MQGHVLLQLYPRKPESQTIKFQNVTFLSVLHEHFFHYFFSFQVL